MFAFDMRIHACMCVFVYMYVEYVYIYMYTYTHIYIYIYLCVCVCVCVCFDTLVIYTHNNLENQALYVSYICFNFLLT